MNETELQQLFNEAMAQTTRDRAKAADYADPENKKFPIMTAASVLSAARLLGRAKGYDDAKRAAVKARIIRIAKRKGFALPKAWQDKKEAFVLSDQMKADALQSALDDERDPDMDGDDDAGYPDYSRGIVRHVFPDNTLVFQMGWDGDWFKRSFTMDDNGDATLGDDCEQVAPQLSFVKYTGTDDDAMQESMASQAIASLDNRDSAVPFDKAYLSKAKDHSETAIHLATKATSEASDDRVKNVAKKIVKEHTPHLEAITGLYNTLFQPSGENQPPSLTTPAANGESFKESAPPQSITFREVTGSEAISSSDDGEDGFHIQGTAINPGVNRSGNRIYPKETLATAVTLFKGKKMYIDHPSAFDEKNRPERSFRDAGAVIQDAWINGSGGIDYKAVVIDPPLREKLALMKKAGALDAMGTSVNYAGLGVDVNYEGRVLTNIERIDALNSLDFVTEPGAWGTIAHMESLGRESVPDAEEELVVNEETKKLLEEMRAALEAQTKATEEARKEAADARKESRIATAKTEIRALLTESALPAVSQDRILAHYEGVETAEGVAETIKAEQEYITRLTEGMTKPAQRGATTTPARRSGVVVGLGATGANANTGTKESETARQPVTPERFAEAFGEFMPGGEKGAEAFARMMG